jgi:hypothetical protein
MRAYVHLHPDMTPPLNVVVSILHGGWIVVNRYGFKSALEGPADLERRGYELVGGISLHEDEMPPGCSAQEAYRRIIRLCAYEAIEDLMAMAGMDINMGYSLPAGTW